MFIMLAWQCHIFITEKLILESYLNHLCCIHYAEYRAGSPWYKDQYKSPTLPDIHDPAHGISPRPV